MEFALSEDQRLLQDSITGFLKDTVPLDVVRRIADGDAEATKAAEQGLADMGTLGLNLPESEGGYGMGLLGACLVQEALGHYVAPSAFLAAAVAGDVLARSGSNLAMGIASGVESFGLALTELSSRRDGAGSRSTMEN